jgi:hypothetical protein
VVRAEPAKSCRPLVFSDDVFGILTAPFDNARIPLLITTLKSIAVRSMNPPTLPDSFPGFPLSPPIRLRSSVSAGEKIPAAGWTGRAGAKVRQQKVFCQDGHRAEG